MLVRALILITAAALLLSGCSLPAKQPTSLYQLDAGQAQAPTRQGDIAVLVGPISVADYLRSPTLLQRQDDHLQEFPQARWATSLPEAIDHQILRQLAWRLNSQRLALAPPSPGFSYDAQVLVTITRLDSGPSEPAVLEAQWRLLDARGRLQDSRLVQLQQGHTGSIGDQVKAQSVLLQRLSDEVAQAAAALSKASEPVAERPNNRPAATTRPRTPTRGDAVAPTQVPKIPIAEPSNEPEVFRF